MNANKSFLYPFVRQSPLLRWQFSPEKPGGQTHRYRPSPVSMQVALIAQGLDEHKRISVVKRERKKKILISMLFLDLVGSLSLPVSLWLIFPLVFVSTLTLHSPPQHLVTKNKTENITNCVTQASGSYAPTE